MLPETNPVSIYLAASLIGFSAGAAISILLLVLTVRAAKLPGTRVASILFAICSLIWNLGGLAHAAAVTSGAQEQGRAALVLLAIQFSAAAAWPITVFALWGPLVTQHWQRAWFRVLQTVSVLSCGAIAIPLWYGAFGGMEFKTFVTLKESTAYNGAILLILGIALFRERLVSRTMRLPSLAMLVGVFGATSGCVVQQLLPYDRNLCYALDILSEQLTLLIVLGAFFLFARFRFSDLFIRYSLRIALGALIAVAFVLLNDRISSFRFESQAAFPETARIFVEALAAFPMLFLFAFVDRHLGECVERWIFRAPDYRTLLRHLSETLATLHEDSAVAQATEACTRQALDLSAVRLIAWGKLSESKLLEKLRDGELVELDCRETTLSDPELSEVELLLPVRTEGRISHVMAVAPGRGRRGLVTHEVNFMRSAVAQFGHRIDALHTEERSAQARSREALLQQQVTEAELRALRAQINPHFLFNSLNSIANLVVTDPEKAETMTVRLARVFRHVLVNSARPLVALDEEIAFLETYLQIEEARFGDRLHVEIAIDPAVAMEPIPSLILQPIVENALKHGLSPKVGPGHLWISADTEGEQIRLRVEDDGVGPAITAFRHIDGSGPSTGVGLENVALRLNALYQDQSRITLETRKAGGTTVTILLPREAALTA
jgi:two-component system LytT family sensor kinase